MQWGKAFRGFESHDETVTVHFEDGSSCVGSLLVGCDGTQSVVREALFPEKHETYKLPIRLVGLKVRYSAEKVARIRELDPITLQGTASENNSYMYFSSKRPCLFTECQDWACIPGGYANLKRNSSRRSK